MDRVTECPPTCYPVVLNLLLIYYIQNIFINHEILKSNPPQ